MALTSTLTVDVMRLRKLFQDPDSGLTSSPYVTVEARHPMLATDDGFPLRTTKTVNEQHSPFYNETFEFPCTAILETVEQAAGSDIPRTVTIIVTVFDSNCRPPAAVGTATVEANVVAGSSKREETLTLAAPAPDESEAALGREIPDADNRGTLTVKLTVQVTKPQKIVDEDADVVLEAAPSFTGQYPLVPPERPMLWWHFANQPHWHEKLAKQIVQSNPVEKPSRGRAAAKRGAAASDDKGGASGGVGAVVHSAWKCKRLHQFMTKYRISACKYTAGEGALSFQPDEEMERKMYWKELQLVRQQAVSRVGVSKRVEGQVERSWIFYLTGDMPNDAPGAPLSFEHRTKMNSAIFGRTQYEQLTECIIGFVEPSLAGTPVAATLAKETFERDPTAQGSKAWKAQQEAGKDAPPSSKDVLDAISKGPTSPTSPASPSAPDKKKPGEAAFELFRQIMTDFCDWWAETLTEEEYVQLLVALTPVITAARERSAAGAAAAAALLGGSTKSPRRPASGKPKRAGSARKSRK